MDRVDQFAFVVRLREGDGHADLGRGVPAERLNVSERGAAVDLGLTRPEEIEIWTIEYQIRLHRQPPSVGRSRRRELALSIPHVAEHRRVFPVSNHILIGPEM